jgi:MarR family transcriptional regulator, lower aerobic nicotinate degradation pathway regulator
MAPNHDATPSRLTSKPTWLISRASVHAHRLLAEALAGVGARGYHYRLLAALAEFGAASQATLGRRTEMDRSDVVAALNELAGRGLVNRATDPHDSRRNIVTITPAGRAELERLDDILTAVQDELLKPLSPRERRTLVALLARVVAHSAGGSEGG